MSESMDQQPQQPQPGQPGAKPPESQQAGPEQQETIGATGDAQGSNLQKDPEEWVSGDDPMTEAQKFYLDTLAKEAGEELPANLTKAQASEHIDRLQGKHS